MALTKNDLNQISRILSIQAEDIKDDILNEIDVKLQKLKSDFYDRVDPVLKEVTTAREERPLIENRLEALEEIHQKGKHSLAR